MSRLYASDEASDEAQAFEKEWMNDWMNEWLICGENVRMNKWMHLYLADTPTHFTKISGGFPVCQAPWRALEYKVSKTDQLPAYRKLLFWSGTQSIHKKQICAWFQIMRVLWRKYTIVQETECLGEQGCWKVRGAGRPLWEGGVWALSDCESTSSQVLVYLISRALFCLFGRAAGRAGS